MSDHALVTRTLPAPDAETAWFWAAGAHGKLLIQHCDVCGHWQHPPLPRCPVCHADAMVPKPVSGQGQVKTFTVNYQRWQPGLDAPYVFAAIELVEQAELYVFSSIVSPVESVHAGMAVSVCFEQHGDLWLPLFRPLADGTGDV